MRYLSIFQRSASAASTTIDPFSRVTHNPESSSSTHEGAALRPAAITINSI